MEVHSLSNPVQKIDSVKIGKYKVSVHLEFGDIVLKAAGFQIGFPEKPNSKPWVRRTNRPASALLDDENHLAEIFALGEKWRQDVHQKIRADWGNSAFKPDKKGKYRHPLFEVAADKFDCIHCEQNFTAKSVADNLWHCPDPECDGSPMDIR